MNFISRKYKNLFEIPFESIWKYEEHVVKAQIQSNQILATCLRHSNQQVQAYSNTKRTKY